MRTPISRRVLETVHTLRRTLAPGVTFVRDLFGSVRNPYARALLAAVPRLHQRGLPRPDLRGEPPSPVDLPSGYRFHPRCPQAADICQHADPEPRPVRPGSTHIVSCHFGADPIPG